MATYTIKQVAEKVNLTVHTIRFYDKEGLLPFVNRDKAGNRRFTDSDVEWLGLICCLKNTGMPIKQIGAFIQSCLEGDATLEQRRLMLVEHRNLVLQQIAEWTQHLDHINFKVEKYTAMCQAYQEQNLSIEVPALVE